MKNMPRPGFFAGLFIAILLTAGAAWAASASAKTENTTGVAAVNVYGSSGKIIEQTSSGAVKVAPGKTEGDNVDGTFPIAGRGPNGKIKVLSLDDNGNLILPSSTCSAVRQSAALAGASPVLVPATPMPGRREIRICNSIENLSSPIVKCLVGTQAPVLGVGNPGDAIGTDRCVTYQVDSTLDVRCIGAAENVGLSVWECA